MSKTLINDANIQKTVLITGCSTGIGYCVAKGLKQRGYRVIATARRKESVEQLVSEGLESLQVSGKEKRLVVLMKNSSLVI